MYSKDPVWLPPEEILTRYKDFCFYNVVTERRLIKLFDSFLLRGRIIRGTRTTEILQESFEDLKNHIAYIHFMQVASPNINVTVPEYLSCKYRLFYDRSNSWYTPTEVLNKYDPFLRNERNFNTEFINDLAQMGLLIGKFNRSEECYYILIRSFVWLMKLREHNVKQYRLFFDENP